MKKINIRFNTAVYLLLTIITCLMSSFLILIDAYRPEYYRYLPALPLSFGLISVVVFPLYKYLFKSVAVTIIIISYFIRMVLTPLIMSLGDYQSLVVNLNIYQEMNIAIILMIYEAVFVFLSLYYYKNKYSEEMPVSSTNYSYNFMDSPVKSYIIVAIFLLLLVISFLLYPQLTLRYKFFIQTNLEQSISHNILVSHLKNSVPIFVYNFVVFFTEIIRVLFVLLLIFLLTKKFNSKLSLLLSLIIVICNSLITSPENAYSLFTLLAYLLLIMKLYPVYKNYIKVAIILGAPSFIIIFLYFKTGIGYSENVGFKNMMFTLSNTLQSYFSGPANISTGLYLNNITEGNKLSLLFSDIGRWTPAVGYFFQNAMDSTQLFNNAMFNSITRRDQIIPYISQGSFYLTGFIAPLLSLFLIKFITKIEIELQRTKNVGSYFFYILTIIIFSTTLVSYNISIFILQVVSVIMPLYFFVNKGDVGHNQK